MRESRKPKRIKNGSAKQLNIEYTQKCVCFFLGMEQRHWERRVMDDVRSPSKYEMPVHIYILEAHKPLTILIRYKLANGIDSTKQNTELTFTVRFKQQSHTVQSFLEAQVFSSNQAFI